VRKTQEAAELTGSARDSNVGCTTGQPDVTQVSDKQHLTSRKLRRRAETAALGVVHTPHIGIELTLFELWSKPTGRKT